MRSRSCDVAILRGKDFMPVVISDEVLKQANLSEREALIEIACRLYDAGKLTFRQADLLAGLSRNEMEAELCRRGLLSTDTPLKCSNRTWLHCVLMIH